MIKASPTPAAANRVPLVVDLDGTLVATDTLWELIVALLKAKPFQFFSLIWWSFSGKAYFKQKLASAVSLDAESLPYRVDCLNWFRAEKSAGRRIWLATGADVRVANVVASHLALFDGVIASNGSKNMTGGNKADLIAEMAGSEYEYAGNAMIDLAVWSKSSSVVVVAPDRGVVAALKRDNIPVAHYFPGPSATVADWLKALRLHQWVKNLLVFTPLITSHRIFDWYALAHAACGFLVFSLVASATYLINDLFDLPADRRHPTKSKRALAAGLIAIPSAVRTVFLLLIAATSLSWFLPWQAGLMVFGYWAATLLYSAVLKKMLIADVVALAMFYTARLFYGGLVTGIEISLWTLAFCAFSFFSLAAAKRINDLARLGQRGADALRHRAYQTQDLNALVSLAAATSNIALLVLILYINSRQVEYLYRHPHFLWAMCIPLLYWFSRILALANRGALGDDPISFATRDRATYFVLAGMLLIAVAAT